MSTTDRRGFLATSAALGATASLASVASADDGSPYLATNEYPWGTFYRREGKNFRADLDASLAEVAEAGFNGFEPLVNSPQYIDKLVPLLAKHKLGMRSFYVNSTLHEKDAVEASIKQVLALARKAKEAAGTTIVVTNPSPLKWGGDQDKSDAQLRLQGQALNRLGGQLRAMGMTLAYHNHDAELRQAAREFHHMLAGTAPENVKFCLDSHWVFRGAGDSEVAVMDAVTLYGKRVAELHLRQSKGGVWTEAFGPGDIDYPALVKRLDEIGVKPNIVLEQAVEGKTPKTMNAKEAHAKGRAVMSRMFAKIAG